MIKSYSKINFDINIGVLTYRSITIIPSYCPALMWCPKISSSRSLHKGLGLHVAKNEEINGIVPYQKFFMSCYITFKKHVGHMWVTSGLFCGSVCQIGHHVWPTFNPSLQTCGYMHGFEYSWMIVAYLTYIHASMHIVHSACIQNVATINPCNNLVVSFCFSLDDKN